MDLQKIKTLLDFVGRSHVSELTVSEAGTTVVIRNPQREAATNAPASVAAEPQATVAAAAAGEDEAAKGRIVRSAMSGVLHCAQSPGAAPLVAAGDRVEAGQALCIIEAMKVFTTVSAPVAGVIKRLFFEDGQEVGFGDPLAEIG